MHQCTVPPQPQPKSISEYLAHLSTERKRLLSWCNPRNPYDLAKACDIFTNAIHTNETIEIAPDGGLNSGRGTFGVVLAVHDAVIWECAGPADGDPTTANSKRSEIAGFASSLELMLLLLKLSSYDYRRSLKSRVTVQAWIDNEGAVNQLNRLMRASRKLRAYPNDQDLTSHIQCYGHNCPE